VAEDVVPQKRKSEKAMQDDHRGYASAFSYSTSVQQGTHVVFPKKIFNTARQPLLLSLFIPENFIMFHLGVLSDCNGIFAITIIIEKKGLLE